MDDERRDYVPVPGLPAPKTPLPEGLRFVDVEADPGGMVGEGRALTTFRPQGYASPTWIHIADEGGDQYTLIVHPLLGSVEIHEERIEKPGF